MIFTKSTAQELVKALADRGQTVVGDDHSFERTLRMIHYGPWVLIVTTADTLSLFEDNKVKFTVHVKDTAHDVADILVRAYEHGDGSVDFEYL